MKKSLEFLICVCFVLLISCEKEIALDLKNSESQIVINGDITDQSGPYLVKIHKSHAVSDTASYQMISQAVVVISDNNGIVDTLKEVRPGYYQTSKIIGKIGNTYFLNVNYSGKVYSSVCKMNTKVDLDSLIQAETKFGSSVQKLLIPIFKDPVELGNRFRVVMKINGFQDRNTNVFNDVINNGQKNFFPIFTKLELKTGDSVNVELQSIDENVHSYFFTLYNIENGAIPTNPPSNISGGCLGYFSAHSSSKLNIVIK